ncbi:MAG: TauD/TfdA dioxygenase family protein [Pseudomonadales bacterium]
MLIRPVDATLGAVISDIDLSTLTDSQWRQVHAAFLQYGVLVFPEQHLDATAQGRFAARFGALEHLSPRGETPTFPIANIKPDGTLAGPGDEQYLILKGNEGWHTDSTYMPLASKAAMLSAVVLPPSGGETEFADMRAAWDALDPARQTELENLSAYHSLFYSQSRQGFSHRVDHLYGFHDKGAPLRPVVKVHPETGRKSIYTGRHAHGLQGMSAEDSERYLDDLLAWACQPPRVYKHAWSVGDLVVWDNRCLMHRACPYDERHPRHLRGSRVSGDPATELAPTFADSRAGSYRPSDSNLSTLVAR